jgi:hypothetical protein
LRTYADFIKTLEAGTPPNDWPALLHVASQNGTQERFAAAIQEAEPAKEL